LSRATAGPILVLGVVVVRKSWLVVVVTAIVLAGCSGTSDEGGNTPTEDSTSSSQQTGEPAPEPTDPESTQSQQEKPSIKLAQLPVGGSADGNCNPVNWLGNDIPAGTTITVGSPTFDPLKIFEVDQSACPGDTRACEGLEWTSDSQEPCSVGFRQVANEGTVTLVIPASVTCASQADCDAVKKKEGSQIELTAVPSETPEETPEETPSGG